MYAAVRLIAENCISPERVSQPAGAKSAAGRKLTCRPTRNVRNFVIFQTFDNLNFDLLR